MASIRGLDAADSRMRARIGFERIGFEVAGRFCGRCDATAKLAARACGLAGPRARIGRGLAFAERGRGLKARIGADWAPSALVTTRIGKCGLVLRFNPVFSQSADWNH